MGGARERRARPLLLNQLRGRIRKKITGMVTATVTGMRKHTTKTMAMDMGTITKPKRMKFLVLKCRRIESLSLRLQKVKFIS
jgi:hypothetical protein